MPSGKTRYSVYYWLHAHEWNEIQAFFSQTRPRSPLESYALFRSLLEKEVSTGEVLKSANNILRIPCSLTKNIKCVYNYKKKYTKSLEQIVIWNLSDYLYKKEMFELVIALAEKVDFSVYPEFNERIYQNLLKTLLKNKPTTQQWSFIEERSKQFTSSLSSFYHARLYAKGKSQQVALSYYLKILAQTNQTWLIKQTAADLRLYFPHFFKLDNLRSSQTKSSFRLLFILSPYLTTEELKALSKINSPNELSLTTNKKLVLGDGIFMISLGSYTNFIRFAKKNKSLLTADILSQWIKVLEEKEKESVTFQLLSFSRSVYKDSPSIWYKYLSLFEKKVKNKKANTWDFFKEILDYVQVYSYYSDGQDMLMKILLGQKEKEIQWASKSFWDLSYRSLKNVYGNERILFWCYRYYKLHGQAKLADEIFMNYYVTSQNSFYRYAFARLQTKQEEPVKTSYITQQSYFKFLGSNYTNLNLYDFIDEENIERYEHKGSVELTQKLFQPNTNKHISSIVKSLLKLGEWPIAIQVYRKLYKKEVSRIDYLSQLVLLGQQTQVFNVSIYYLRQLMYEMKIPTDPFQLSIPLLNILYPTPYEKKIEKYAQKYKIEKEMIYAIIHQESFFRHAAISPSGARGLMQLMPTTARWLSSKMKIHYDIEKIHKLEKNINIGTYYLEDLLERNDNDLCLASIAYNGGPGNLRKWTKNHKSIKEDLFLFIEKIPVKESRDYCRKVKRNYLDYKTLFMRLESQNTKQNTQ